MEWLAAVVAGEAADLGDIDDELLALLHAVALVDLAICRGARHRGLEGRARRTFAATQAGLKVAAEALAALRATGVPAVTLKGPVLAARHWGDVLSRPSVDVDVLVEPGDVPRARAALSEVGFTPDAAFPDWYMLRWHYDVVYRSPRPPHVGVELKWNVCLPYLGRVPVREIIAGATPVDCGGLELPAPRTSWQLITCATHAVKHCFTLRQLLDVAFIVRDMAPADCQEVVAEARRARLWPALHYAVGVSASRLGWRPPLDFAELRPSPLRDWPARAYLSALPPTNPGVVNGWRMHAGKFAGPLLTSSALQLPYAIPASLSDRPNVLAALGRGVVAARRTLTHDAG
jgi:Uncharacterised nucleotidyltransferase